MEFESFSFNKEEIKKYSFDKLLRLKKQCFKSPNFPVDGDYIAGGFRVQMPKVSDATLARCYWAYLDMLKFVEKLIKDKERTKMSGYLSDEELEKLTTPRLLAYKRKHFWNDEFPSLEEFDKTWDGMYDYETSYTEYMRKYNYIKELLSKREHVPCKRTSKGK